MYQNQQKAKQLPPKKVNLKTKVVANKQVQLSAKPGQSLSFKEVESRRGKNVIIVDTNVLIESVDRAIPDLQKGGNLLVIPYQVLIELDGLKKKYDTSEEAQRAIKAIHALQTANKGNLIIEKEQRKLKYLDMTIADHRILATVNYVLLNRKLANSPYMGYDKIKLITNDINMQIFAKEVGLDSSLIVEPYKSDQVKLPKNQMQLKKFKIKSADILFDKETEQSYYLIKSRDKLPKNDAVLILTEEDGYKKPQFAAVPEGDRLIFLKNTFNILGIKPLSKKGTTNWEQIIAVHYVLDPKKDLVILQGGAGTGKTLIALLAGIEGIAQGRYDQIIIVRSVVGPPDEDMGYQAGDMNNKASHWMVPIFQNISLINTRSTNRKKDGKQTATQSSPGNGIVTVGNEGMKLLENLKIYFQSIQHIRGTTPRRALVIVEEAQNLNRAKIKTIITRAGSGTKVILTGDLSQIDNPRISRESSGLAHAIAKMRNYPIVHVQTLNQSVRSQLAELAANVL